MKWQSGVNSTIHLFTISPICSVFLNSFHGFLLWISKIFYYSISLSSNLVAIHTFIICLVIAVRRCCPVGLSVHRNGIHLHSLHPLLPLGVSEAAAESGTLQQRWKTFFVKGQAVHRLCGHTTFMAPAPFHHCTSRAARDGTSADHCGCVQNDFLYQWGDRQVLTCELVCWALFYGLVPSGGLASRAWPQGWPQESSYHFQSHSQGAMWVPLSLPLVVFRTSLIFYSHTHLYQLLNWAVLKEWNASSAFCSC